MVDSKLLYLQKPYRIPIQYPQSSLSRQTTQVLTTSQLLGLAKYISCWILTPKTSIWLKPCQRHLIFSHRLFVLETSPNQSKRAALMVMEEEFTSGRS